MSAHVHMLIICNKTLELYIHTIPWAFRFHFGVFLHVFYSWGRWWCGWLLDISNKPLQVSITQLGLVQTLTQAKGVDIVLYHARECTVNAV